MRVHPGTAAMSGRNTTHTYVSIVLAERSSSDVNQIYDMLILVPSNLITKCSIFLAASRN